MIFLASCTKETALDCFKSNGKDVTEIRYPGEFRVVQAYDNLEVNIVHGSEYKVEITAGEHIIKNISTKVVAETLKLDNTNTCNFVRGYKRKVKMTITAPYLDQASNYGVGPVTIEEGFDQDKFFVLAENSGDVYLNGNFGELRTSSHGNGDMYLKGKTKRLLVYSNGTNFTWADGLEVTDYIFISTYSIGDAYLNLDSTGTIDYYIWSDGNIYYKGPAHSTKRLNADATRGRLIQEN